ncbi:MAG TPA: hypothetical protein PLZ57_02425 [Pseudobdellovibrionaceae bacterium]|nr:hypothetical protein [Pseudobdellovibrionaceae bacterium]
MKRRHGGQVPYRYKMAKGHCVKHIREQKILQQIRRMKKHGWSNAKISDWLYARGVRSPAESVWHPVTEGRVLWTGLS